MRCLFYPLRQLAFFCLKQLMCLFNQRVCLLHLRLLLTALRFRGGDIILVARNQFPEFLRSLPIEFNQAAVICDLGLQPLHLGSRLANPIINFIQLESLGGEAILACLDCHLRFPFDFPQARDLFAAAFELCLELIQLTP